MVCDVSSYSILALLVKMILSVEESFLHSSPFNPHLKLPSWQAGAREQLLIERVIHFHVSHDDILGACNKPMEHAKISGFQSIYK